jgi:catechol 2,3-dioxygenase
MADTKEPIYDIAHLAHLEMFTPKFDASARFFIDVMGMTQSGEKGDSIYLRGWDDYERYTLKLTASKTSGMGHVAFRTRSPQALERRAAALKGSGFDIGWTDGDLGHGKTFVCQDPDGHRIELYYDTEWYDAPQDKKPALKNQAQRFPARGVNVRRLDHFNGLAVDIAANRKFFEDYLGFRLTEQIVLNDGTEAGMWMTATNKSYDFAYTHDHTNTKGRFHHVTYALDSREEILRAADIFLENVCSSRPVRISTRSSRRSFCMSMSRAVTGSKWPMPARGSFSPRTGSRSRGRKRSAKRARPGACRRSRRSTATARHRFSEAKGVRAGVSLPPRA